MSETLAEIGKCDACGDPIMQGEAVCFENTPDGGWLAHRSCCQFPRHLRPRE